MRNGESKPRWLLRHYARRDVLDIVVFVCLDLAEAVKEVNKKVYHNRLLSALKGVKETASSVHRVHPAQTPRRVFRLLRNQLVKRSEDVTGLVAPQDLVLVKPQDFQKQRKPMPKANPSNINGVIPASDNVVSVVRAVLPAIVAEITIRTVIDPTKALRPAEQSGSRHNSLLSLGEGTASSVHGVHPVQTPEGVSAKQV